MRGTEVEWWKRCVKREKGVTIRCGEDRGDVRCYSKCECVPSVSVSFSLSAWVSVSLSLSLPASLCLVSRVSLYLFLERHPPQHPPCANSISKRPPTPFHAHPRNLPNLAQLLPWW